MKHVCAKVTVLCLLFAVSVPATSAAELETLFHKDNLVAWCIVPFDAQQRSPQQRAEMLVRLGLKHVAYDWRAKHVPEFEEEILQYKRHGLNYFAFWSWHDAMEPLIRKHGIRPQIWMMMKNSKQATQAERVADAAKHLLPMVQKADGLKLKVGIYNHGGWAGQPENMVAVCEYLQTEHAVDNIGIVYNFHHGHEHIDHFAHAFAAMQPWLLCVNINGMTDAANAAAGQKILPVGDGKHEAAMLKIVADSGYAGPIGILDHRNHLDAEESLKQNLNGLRQLIREKLDTAKR